MRIILASSSKYRQQIFDRLGFEYETKNPHFEEKEKPGIEPVQQIKNFALGKAQSVFDTLSSSEKDVLVLGFDSVMLGENKTIIGKQKTKKQAFETLQSYRGKKMEFVTGVALVGQWKGKTFKEVFHESSFISFRSDVTNCQLRSYLDFGDWKNKGGGFSVNGPAVFLIEKIEGDFHSIIGVPIRSMGKKIESITGKRIFTILKKRTDKEQLDTVL